MDCLKQYLSQELGLNRIASGNIGQIVYKVVSGNVLSLLFMKDLS